jgi:hypothetical protein
MALPLGKEPPGFIGKKAGQALKGGLDAGAKRRILNLSGIKVIHLNEIYSK